MARKKKFSKLHIAIFSTICFVLGAVIGFLSSVVLSLPDSYKIPGKVTGSKSALVSAGSMNSEFINNSSLSIHFLELGNKYAGDCTYIKVGDIDILVDSGSKVDSIPYITSYVDSYCTDKTLDFVIVTHAHEDHYAGFSTHESGESIFDHYSNQDTGTKINTVITFSKHNKSNSHKMFSNFMREIGELKLEGVKVHNVLDCFNSNKTGVDDGTPKRNYVLGQDEEGNDIILQFLYHKFYEEHAETENDYSVVFQIVQGEKKYLFTGDLEKEGEESLVEDERNKNTLTHVEVYKAGHHGSKTSSSDKLMYAIQPKIVVVTCVAGSSEYTSKNANQFPTQEFVDNVSIYTDNIYVTSLCVDYEASKFESFNGTIAICSSGDDADDKTTVLSTNHQVVLRESEWFKTNRTLPKDEVIDEEDNVAA